MLESYRKGKKGPARREIRMALLCSLAEGFFVEKRGSTCSEGGTETDGYCPGLYHRVDKE